MVNAHAVTFGGLVMFSGASLLGGFATGQFAAARVLTELPADRANRRDRTVTGIVGLTRLVYGGSSPTDRSDAYLIMLFIGTAMFGMFFFLTQFMQTVLGYSAVRSGISHLPFAAENVTAAGLATPPMAQIGARPLPPRRPGCSGSPGRPSTQVTRPWSMALFPSCSEEA